MGDKLYAMTKIYHTHGWQHAKHVAM